MSRIMQNHAQANRPFWSFCGRTWPWLANQQDVELNTSWGFSEDSMFIYGPHWSILFIRSLLQYVDLFIVCLPWVTPWQSHQRSPGMELLHAVARWCPPVVEQELDINFYKATMWHKTSQKVFSMNVEYIMRTCSSHASFTLQPLASRYYMFLVVLCSQYLFNFNSCAKSPMWFCGNYRPKWCSCGKFTLPLGLSFLRLPSTFSSLHLPRSSRSKTLASHVITRYNSTSCKHEASGSSEMWSWLELLDNIVQIDLFHVILHDLR